MKNIHHKQIIFVLIFLGIGINTYSQKRQRRAKMDGYNFSAGLRVGEPTGVEAQWYFGGTMATKKRSAAFFKSWSVHVAYGIEDVVPFALPEKYGNRIFVSGGRRFEVNFLKYFYSTNNYEVQFYGGLGIQTGTRNFKPFASAKEESRTASSTNIILGLESELGRIFLNPQRTTYLISTFFIEGRGSIELAPEVGWYYTKYGAGIRFNFWR